MEGSTNSLSTIAIYDKASNKTVLYLHADPNIKVGTKVKKGDLLGEEDKRAGGRVHTHIEVRDGKRTHAAKSVRDETLDNKTPASYWKSKGYIIK